MLGRILLPLLPALLFTLGAAAQEGTRPAAPLTSPNGWCDGQPPRADQHAEWDGERNCWGGVDRPAGLPSALHELIRLAQRDHGVAMTQRQTAYGKMVVSDLGLAWQNLAKAVEDRAAALAALETSATKECEKRGLIYSARLITCVVQPAPIAGATEGVKP